MEESIEELKKLWFGLTPKEGIPCAYCGVLATDKEHVTPISWIERSKELKALGFDIKVPKEEIVMACHECNVIAYARIFESFLEKRTYIRYKLVLKYQKWMFREEWSDKELNELGGNFRRQMVLYNEILKAVKARMSFIKGTVIFKNIDYFDNLYHK